MYYKKIAVINDNSQILVKFLKILGELNLDASRFHLFCSPETDIGQFPVNKCKIEKIDLRNEFEKIIQDEFNLIISLHCRQIFPELLISKIKCINVHPGYNPINRGWYPQVFALVYGLEVGATIHEMDNFVDHGNIIDRVKVPYDSWDTSGSIYERILQAEEYLMRKNLVDILNNNYETFRAEDEGNYFSKKDYENLCRLDLAEKADYKTVINRLRALSHNRYKNAWFIDEKTGKKVYVSVSFEVEKSE